MSASKNNRWVLEDWDPLSGPGTPPANNSLDVEVLAGPAMCYKHQIYLAGVVNDPVDAGVSDEDVAKVCDAMAECTWHVFQVVTNNPSRLANLVSNNAKVQRSGKRSNIWWGVRVSAQADLSRIGELRAAAVEKRFLLLEPLREDLGQLKLDKIDWVVAGGSPDAPRCLQLDWARSIRTQCEAAGVPFSFNGWGNGLYGRSLDGKVYDQRPGWEAEAIPVGRHRPVAADCIRSRYRQQRSGS